MASQHPDRCCPTDATAATCVYHPAGNDFYIAGPLDSKAGIIVVSDIFGMLPNSKRLADVLGNEGFLTIMPDFFHDKAWDEHNWPPNFDSAEWQAFIHWARDFDQHKPRVEQAAEVLRKLGVEKVGVMGLCWGSVLTFQVSADGLVDSICAAHPSFLTVEAVNGAKTPMLVMPSKDEPPMDDIEAAIKAHPSTPHEYKRFDKIPHGFLGARYDPDTYSPEELAEVEEARSMAIDFFKRTLH